MTKQTTPDQARKYANGMVPNSTVATMLRSLAEQVEVLTAERDEWKARCEFSFEQRDDISERYQTASRLADSSLEALSKALKERDALKDAARLALDALEQLHSIDTETEIVTIWVEDEIAALKAVL